MVTAGFAHATSEHALVRVTAWVPTACEIRTGEPEPGERKASRAQGQVRMRCTQSTFVTVSVTPSGGNTAYRGSSANPLQAVVWTAGEVEPYECHFTVQARSPGTSVLLLASTCAGEFAPIETRDARVTATF